jgi:hypothetical protein
MRALQPLATAEMVGQPFGPGFGLEVALDLVPQFLWHPAEVRASGIGTARAIVSQPAVRQQDLSGLMGATEASFRLAKVSPDNFRPVVSLAGAAREFLYCFEQRTGVYDLWESWDDVAAEFLCWHAIALKRLQVARGQGGGDRAAEPTFEVPPEELTADLQATRRNAQGTTASGYATIVRQFRHLYEAGDLHDVWQERCAFGISAGPSMMDSEDWFWFNAYPALAGLRLGKMPGFPLDNICGLADASVDYGDTAQINAAGAIQALYRRRWPSPQSVGRDLRDLAKSPTQVEWVRRALAGEQLR